MTEVVHKGGQFIIQDDTKKGTEATYLALFARHKIGEKWMQDNGITTKKACECPDFIFEVPDWSTIGLEIVNFIYKSDKNIATMRLETIAKKVVGHFKQRGVPLSLVIDVYDPREWSSNLAEHMNACYNPGFDHLNASDEELKKAFINALESEGIKPGEITKKWVEAKGQTFIITGSLMHEPHSSCHVNNMGRCIEDPFDEIQNLIDAKNKKIESYKKNCDECDLLLVVDNGFVCFSDKLQEHRFKSVFRNVYLMDLSCEHKVSKLKIYK